MNTELNIVLWIFLCCYGNTYYCFGHSTVLGGFQTPTATPRFATVNCSQGPTTCDFENDTCGFMVAYSTDRITVYSSIGYIDASFHGTSPSVAGFRLLGSPCMAPGTYNLTFQYNLYGSVSLALGIRTSSIDAWLGKNISQVQRWTWASRIVHAQTDFKIVFVIGDAVGAYYSHVSIDNVGILPVLSSTSVQPMITTPVPASGLPSPGTSVSTALATTTNTTLTNKPISSTRSLPTTTQPKVYATTAEATLETNTTEATSANTTMANSSSTSMTTPMTIMTPEVVTTRTTKAVTQHTTLTALNISMTRTTTTKAPSTTTTIAPSTISTPNTITTKTEIVKSTPSSTDMLNTPTTQRMTLKKSTMTQSNISTPITSTTVEISTTAMPSMTTTPELSSTPRRSTAVTTATSMTATPSTITTTSRSTTSIPTTTRTATTSTTATPSTITTTSRSTTSIPTTARTTTTSTTATPSTITTTSRSTTSIPTTTRTATTSTTATPSTITTTSRSTTSIPTTTRTATTSMTATPSTITTTSRSTTSIPTTTRTATTSTTATPSTITTTSRSTTSIPTTARTTTTSTTATPSTITTTSRSTTSIPTTTRTATTSTTATPSTITTTSRSTTAIPATTRTTATSTTATPSTITTTSRSTTSIPTTTRTTATSTTATPSTITTTSRSTTAIPATTRTTATSTTAMPSNTTTKAISTTATQRTTTTTEIRTTATPKTPATAAASTTATPSMIQTTELSTTPRPSTTVTTATSPTATPSPTTPTATMTTATPNRTTTTDISTTATSSSTTTTDISTTATPRTTTTTEISTAATPSTTSTPSTTTTTEISTTETPSTTSTPSTTTTTATSTTETPRTTTTTEISTTATLTTTTTRAPATTTEESTTITSSTTALDTTTTPKCDDPISPNNGDAHVYHHANAPSYANYSCHTGYDLYSANGSSIMCLPSGRWSFVIVSCRIRDCGWHNLPTISNGNVTATATTYGSAAYIMCDDNFTLEGRNLVKCAASGNWITYGAKCVLDLSKIKCKIEHDDRGTWWPETKRNQVVVKDCNTFQNTLTGEIKRRCGNDGHWHLPIYDCVSQKLREVESKVDNLKRNKSAENVQDVLSTLVLTTDDTGTAEPMLDGELTKVTTLLETIATVSDNIEVSTEQSQDFINTAANLLDANNQQSWEALATNEKEEEEASSGAAKVLDVVDTYATAIATTLIKSNETTRTIENKNMALRVAKIDETKKEDIHFPDNKVQTIHTKSSILMKSSELKGIRSYSAVVYKNLTGILPTKTEDETKKEQTINSVVISLDLHGTSGSSGIPVMISLEHFDKYLESPVCSFWNTSLNAWDSKGCKLISTNSSISVCKCTHLTNFAILMSPWTEENVMSKAIDVISMIGCSVSLVALIVTVAAHVYLWRYLKSDRTVILMHLSTALAASYVVFLAGVDRTENKGACTAIAAILQYIYLTVFSLMLVEGIELAITVLYVFKTGATLKWMLPLAWGAPAVITGISLGATQLKGYGTDNFCWLSVDGGIIWGFFGPALCIILVNSVLLILIIRAMFRAKSISEKSNSEKVKVGVKSLCVLLPLMGCTWVLGMFYVNEDFAWMQYMFAICNSFQGLVIFLFHCAFNAQIRSAMKRKRRKYLASRTKPSYSARQTSSRTTSFTSFSEDGEYLYSRSCGHDSYDSVKQ